MSILSPVFKKGSELFSVSNITAKTSRFVPIETQIRGVKLFVNIKSKVWGAQHIPRFDDSPLPDVDELELKDIDLSHPLLYRQGKCYSYYKRLRDECPVHYQSKSPFGPFWSITRFDDIRFVDTHHDLFSSEPLIIVGDEPEGLKAEMFIAMDPPKHDVQRLAVQNVVAPKNLKEMESLIRSRTEDVLDGLPVNEPFDWVEAVSIELTTRMLATLFDFPYKDRRKLTRWSDVIGGAPTATGSNMDSKEIYDCMAELARDFSLLWRVKAEKQAKGEEMGYDLISLLLSNDDTKDMINRPMEFLGNIGLLIVGGNDTTRNSMTGGVFAFSQFSDEFVKLKNNPSLIPNMVSEIIRWQTPLPHMRRVATQDVEMNGQIIRKGDKVVMWYASGNRDERVIENPDDFIIDRKNARNHLSFGFGVHRCMGNRLAEMQLRILWEEILKRFTDIEVLEEPEYVQSNFVRGYKKMTVKLTGKA